MKATIVLVVLAVVALIRLGLRRRRQGGSSEAHGGFVARFRDKRLLGDTGLVAGREVRERLRGRVFRVVTIILFAAVAAAVVIPTIQTSSAKRLRVGVVAGSAELGAQLQALAKNVPVSVELIDKADLSSARSDLSAGRLDMVVDGMNTVVVKDAISASDASAFARYVRIVATTLGVQHAFAQAGLTPEQAGDVARARPLPVDSIHPNKKNRTTAEATALLGVILIFVVLTQYLTWTLMGVLEEKASRVVEVLLATVKPTELLAGKVTGIGAVALAQSLALVAFAFVLARAVGSSLVEGAAPFVVVAILVWLILGYALYSWMYAAAGSLGERQDQVQSMALPLSAPLIFGYIVSLVGVSSGNPSLLVKVLAYVPFTAPFAMPTLVGFGEASWWQFLLSVLITLVCTFFVARLAAAVYRGAVLRTGGRVRIRELLPATMR
jgi:ABC-2 type transport system permease protein